MKVCSVEGCEGKFSAKGYCRKHYGKFWRHGDPLKGVEFKIYVITKLLVDGVEVDAKECAKCGVVKSLNEFKIQRHGTGGRGGRCKSCAAEDSSIYRRKTFKQQAAYKAKYDRENREHRVKKAAERYQINKEKVNLQAKTWYQANRESCSQRAAKWRKENPDKVCATGHRRRALIRNAVSNDFTAEDWVKSLNHFKNECAYCGCRNKKFHQEHVVPLFKGGSNTITNIVPACATCNHRKNKSLIEEWYHKQPFYSSQREAKIYKWIGYKVHEDALQATLF